MKEKFVWFVNKVLWFWHPLEGALVVLFYYQLTPVLAVLWFLGIMWYQKQEYKEINDTCAVDMRDTLIGFGIALCLAVIGTSLRG